MKIDKLSNLTDEQILIISEKKSEIESLMNEYDSIIDSYIDKSIIKSLKDEFNKLPETYRLNIDIELRGDKGKGHYIFGQFVDVARIGYAVGTGSDHTISYNKTAGKRTFKSSNKNRIRKWLSNIQSSTDIKELDWYLSIITDDVNIIKGIVNPKTDYIVYLTYSKGNSGVNDFSKLKEICGRVFAGKAKHVGKNSIYNQKMTQHYRTGNTVDVAITPTINSTMILKVKDFSKSTVDLEILEYQENGVEIGVTAWTGNIMVDRHIAEEYNQLKSIGLMDEVEGYMSYHGNLSPQDLVTKLISMGFNSILDK